MIVDTSNYRLAVVSGSVILRSYQVGLGGSKTPQGTFHISDKVVNPNGKSDGEFGSRGMQLSDTNYAIHGTNEPDSIGKDESLGCIRMGKKDVEELFDLLPMGTKVTIGKGGLPDQDLIPAKRFTLGKRQDQSNPHRTYRWLQ
ncbi:putative L,D-transpeptidase YkuD [compost metagenome]